MTLATSVRCRSLPMRSKMQAARTTRSSTTAVKKPPTSVAVGSSISFWRSDGGGVYDVETIVGKLG
jgi:hypothetical protein